MRGKLQAPDWANLNKYQNENASLLPLEPGEQRIVFIGDSITEFWSILDPEYFSVKSYLNRGISGQTTPQMLVRFRADVVALQPEIVVILAGINDIAGNTGPTTLYAIANNLYSMAELAQANHIKVILCSVLPANDFPWNPNQKPAEKIRALNTMIKNYADAKGILYLDYFSSMKDEYNGLKATYSGDGVHPNKLGYQIMASLAEKAINQVLAT